jgi:hypothetical protein
VIASETVLTKKMSARSLTVRSESLGIMPIR